MSVPYLLDEHIAHAYRVQLLRRDSAMIVWTIGDPGAPPTAAPDPDALRWCEAHGFILITNNRKSMPRHLRDHLARGGHVPGMFQLDPEKRMAEILDELILIERASFEHEYRDRIVYLPMT